MTRKMLLASGEFRTLLTYEKLTYLLNLQFIMLIHLTFETLLLYSVIRPIVGL